MRYVIEVTVETDAATAHALKDAVNEYVQDAPAWLPKMALMGVSIREEVARED